MLNWPLFQLYGPTLPYTDSYKYLGHIVNSSLTDDADIMKQTRSLYARANMIIWKFLSASLNTRLMLFKAYCTPMYGCQLWCSLYQYSFNKLRVAYNDAFRQLLQEPRWCIASKLFVLNSVSSLPENKRKLIYSLWRSLQISDNSLVKAVLSSDLFFNSPLFEYVYSD